MKPFPILFSRAGFAALATVAGISLLPTTRAQAQFAAPNQGARPALTAHSPRVLDYHVRHLKLIFDVNAKDHSAHGVVTHYLTPLRAALQTVVLDARDNLKIEACKINGTDVTFAQKDNQLTISPVTPLAMNKEVAVEISYTMPSANSRVRGGANGAGGFTWIDPRANQPARKVGFWTQGETNTNSSWVPCYDFPNDKCTSETHTTVPEDWIVIGNGAETPSTLNADAHTRTFHWTMKQPHSTYLLSLVGGELDVQKDTWRGVPLLYVVPKGMGNLIPNAFGNTPDMLSWFSDNLGVKYPWPKYAQSWVFDFPGGMENVSATTLGSFSLPDARADKFPMSSLTSHELGHQWFGDLVTCKDWGDIWLNESFATFMEMFYMEHLNGKEAYEADVENYTRQYLASARRAKRALSTNMYANYDAMFESGHTYSKGGVILHMLRRELGDKAFFASLHRYLKAYEYKAVETSDLEKSISEETHRDMKPFFDQWVRKPGHPVLDMTWTYDEGRKEVVATVKQLQNTTDGTPIYNTPLTFGLARGMGEKPSGFKQVGLAGEKARTSSQAGNDMLQRQRVVLNQATQEFHLPCAQKPALVLLDPDHDMLKEVPDTHLTDADMALLLRIAPNSADRRMAASKLVGDHLDVSRIALFTDVLKAEPGDALGATLIISLSTAKSEELRPLFHAEAQSKLTRRRAAALAALGQLAPTDEDTRLLRSVALSDTEPSSVVSGALLGLSGNIAKNMDVFQHQIMQTGSGETLASASVDALAAAKSETTVPLLILAMKPEHSSFTRMKAAGAVGTFAPGDAGVHDALVGMLNDPLFFVQNAAIRALAARKDKGAMDALRAVAANAKNPSTQEAAKTAIEQIQAQ